MVTENVGRPVKETAKAADEVLRHAAVFEFGDDHGQVSMRATRAYMAGLGTAGSVLAGCAVLFVVASAVVAFSGWPAIAGQGSSVSVRLDARAPAPGSQVGHRLASLLAPAAPAPAPTAGVRRRSSSPAPGGTPSPAVLRGPSAAGATLGTGRGATGRGATGRGATGRGATGRGATGPVRFGRPVAGTGTGSGSGSAGTDTGATSSGGSGGRPAGVAVKLGGVTVIAGGNHGVTVTAPGTPITPPVTVTVPNPPARGGPASPPTDTAGSVVQKVTGTAGSTIFGTGAAAGNAVGGSVGETIGSVSGAVGSTVSQLGGPFGVTPNG